MPNYLYVIGELPNPFDEHEHLYVKIGVSDNPTERLKQLQTANPRPLQLIAVRPVRASDNRDTYEASVHEKFKIHRVNGEWFYRHDDVMHWVYRNMLLDVEDALSRKPEDNFEELGAQKTYERWNLAAKKAGVLDQVVEQVKLLVEMENEEIREENKIIESRVVEIRKSIQENIIQTLESHQRKMELRDLKRECHSERHGRRAWNDAIGGLINTGTLIYRDAVFNEKPEDQKPEMVYLPKQEAA